MFSLPLNSILETIQLYQHFKNLTFRTKKVVTIRDLDVSTKKLNESTTQPADLLVSLFRMVVERV